MTELNQQLNLLDKLRAYGFHIEIDDFGSGYSSLNMLKDITVDVLKLDMGFLRKSEHEEKGRVIMNAIITLSKKLGLSVITEGVETAEQVEYLTGAGCDMFQGYYFAKPMPVTDFEQKYLAYGGEKGLDGKAFGEKIIQNISRVIVGKEQTARLLLTALLADGHVLLEDVPGTGKTKLAKTLAKSIDAAFSRIQFTPDLLPSDVTGLNVYDRQKNEFVLRKGPVFTNILLADEINRATPRTQAGLLECMEERQVTIDGETYIPGRPFFVVATQNPVETTGTYPLPEAQLDRFMMRLSMGLPQREEELSILKKYMETDPLNEIERVLALDELNNAKKEVNQIFVHDCVREYMVDIAAATREGEQIIAGVSPRGTLALLRCAKAYAFLDGRDFVTPDDVRALTVPVLAHRIVMGYGTDADGVPRHAEKLLERALTHIPVPTEEFRR